MNKDLNEQLNNGFMDLGETKKRKLVSSKNIAILFLIIGLGIIVVSVLGTMNNTLSNAVYVPLFMTGIGILLSGILISLLVLIKLFEKVG